MTNRLIEVVEIIITVAGPCQSRNQLLFLFLMADPEKMTWLNFFLVSGLVLASAVSVSGRNINLNADSSCGNDVGVADKHSDCPSDAKDQVPFINFWFWSKNVLT